MLILTYFLIWTYAYYMSITFAGAKSKTQQINLKQLPNDVNKSNDKEVSKQTGSSMSQT